MTSSSLMQRDPFIAGIVLLLWLLLGIFVRYPLACLFARAFSDGGTLSIQPLLDVMGNPNHCLAFGNSLTLALVVGVGGTARGFLFAFTAVRAGLSKRVMGFIDTATLLPLISPPFTISVAILFSFGARGLITYDLLGIKGFAIYGFMSTAGGRNHHLFSDCVSHIAPDPFEHRPVHKKARSHRGRHEARGQRADRL